MSISCHRFPDSRLLIFAKAPVIGQVKTRLIPAIGAAAACNFYRQCLYTTIARMTHANIAPVTVYVTDMQHPAFRKLPEHVALRSQCGNNLGERMAQAIDASLGNHTQHVIVIGTDAPSLTPDDVAQGFCQLRSGADVVMTPAEDGGYVLIGMKQQQPALFQAVPWSTTRVAALTRQRCQAQNLRLHELPTRWDIDCAADLARFYQQAHTFDSYQFL
ncbi:MAG: TIGR04282 family arsenosugar biosynthesis glycosyltransferase [Pseudomonadota bacterium]